MNAKVALDLMGSQGIGGEEAKGRLETSFLTCGASKDKASVKVRVTKEVNGGGGADNAVHGFESPGDEVSA